MMLQRRQCPEEEKKTNKQIETHETDVAWHNGIMLLFCKACKILRLPVFQ